MRLLRCWIAGRATSLRACIVLLCVLGGTRTARADAIFRPLIADPRENLSRWRIVTATEDWRYGTDITDSTSHGGVAEDRRRIEWEAAAGHVFRWRPWRFARAASVPWSAAQVGAPAAIFATFDNSGSLLNTDFQFGGELDLQWTGQEITAAPGGRMATPPGTSDAAGHGASPADSVGSAAGATREANPRPFDRPVITSRFTIYHRSSHLGDEYITLGRFGRNQTGHPNAGALFDHPPVKRIDLTYEAVSLVVSCEWSPAWAGRRSVARAYAGGETKLVLPGALEIGALRPGNFRAPSARFGFEYRASGNGGDPPDGWLTRWANRLVRERFVASSWFGAADLRLAKPYNFASGDNPDGEDERWTPRLWTAAPYGREFRHYAGSWHAMLGAVLWPAAPPALSRTPLGGPEWLLSLEWYHGYSFNGQFLDERARFHPRWYVVPSVTARF